MTSKHRIALLALAAAALLAGCSGIPRREGNALTLARFNDHAGEPVDSFVYLGRFDSWQALSGNKLVVWTTFDRPYLLTVETGCPSLQFAQHIGLTSSSGRVSRGFDSIRLPDHEHCRITEIRPVDYQALKAEKRAGG